MASCSARIASSVTARSCTRRYLRCRLWRDLCLSADAAASPQVVAQLTQELALEDPREERGHDEVEHELDDGAGGRAVTAGQQPEPEHGAGRGHRGSERAEQVGGDAEAVEQPPEVEVA